MKHSIKDILRRSTAGITAAAVLGAALNIAPAIADGQATSITVNLDGTAQETFNTPADGTFTFTFPAGSGYWYSKDLPDAYVLNGRDEAVAPAYSYWADGASITGTYNYRGTAPTNDLTMDFYRWQSADFTVNFRDSYDGTILATSTPTQIEPGTNDIAFNAITSVQDDPEFLGWAVSVVPYCTQTPDKAYYTMGEVLTLTDIPLDATTVTVEAWPVYTPGVTVTMQETWLTNPEPVEYNGEEQKLKPTVVDPGDGTYGPKTLEEGTHYELVYDEGGDYTNAGEAQVGVSGIASHSYSGWLTSNYRILRRDVKFSAPSAEKEYDGTPLTTEGAEANVSEGSLVNGHTVDIPLDGSITDVGSISVTLDAGTNAVVLDADKKNVSMNYNISLDEGSTGTLTVTQRTITVNETAETITYDGEPHVGSYTIENLPDTLNATDSISEYVDAGAYDIDSGVEILTPDGNPASADNVNLVTNPAQLVIAPRPVEIKALSSAETYTGDEIALTDEFENGSPDGIAITVGARTYHVRGLSASASGTEVGTYENTITGTPQVFDETDLEVPVQNFTFTYTPGTLTVEPGETSQVELFISSVDVVYDGQPHKAEITAQGLPTGYTFDITYQNEQTDVVDGMGIEYAYTIKNPAGEDVTGLFTDHVTVIEEGSITIRPKEVTVTANNLTKYEGENDPTYTITCNGLVGTDPEPNDGTLDFSRVDGEAPGTYEITVTGPAADGNYTYVYVPGTLTIQAIDPITITTTGENATYDGQAHGATVAITGLPAGYTYNATSSASNTNAGEYTVTCDMFTIFDDTGADVTSRYTGDKVNYSDGTQTISQAPVTVTADSVTIAFGEADPALTATVTGTLNGDTVAYTLSREAGTEAGDYAITATGAADQGNYTVTFVAGTLTIAPEDATPTPTPTSTPTPTPDPDATPTPTPTPDPDATPTPTPTPDPDATPTPTPTATPTATPTPTPTPTPKPAGLKYISITYSLDGGSLSEKTTKKVTQKDADQKKAEIDLPEEEPYKEGYTFEGWKCNQDDKTYYAGETVTLKFGSKTETRVRFTAKWAEIVLRTAHAGFDLKGGTAVGCEGMDFIQKTMNEAEFALQLPTSTPEKFEAFFDYWQCSANDLHYMPGDIVVLPYNTKKRHTDVVFTAHYTDALKSAIRFNAAGGTTSGVDQILVQPTRRTGTFEVTLPEDTPVKNKGYFEGWLNSIDGQIYPEGTSFTYNYADIRELSFIAQWTPTIGNGNYDLTSGTKYRLEGGSWTIAGDNTTYYGHQYVYAESGSYTFSGK